ncbi:hypothetical protein CVT25_009610 [Psilocybe cyanescens]|uniref:FAD/NAD(P)-binding domain-containing protein n=1 Tax=Psilocybe cyanescens TaxID=93625 RepID=A0A409XGU6_PSICY|nr:hypothetical protein CVT25_009610 [Psilocybe cyanescens]
MASNPPIPTTQTLSQPVGILGAGVAGLINAYVLLQDGFTDITVITRDRSVGGVWSRDRVYPGLHINSVHGEYRFSPLAMPRPEDSAETGGHITGMGMCNYMETFYVTFLKNKVKFKFETEITSVRRVQKESWEVKVEDIHSRGTKVLSFARIVLATGGCSNPQIPDELSLDGAKKAKFAGVVFHSSEFRIRLDEILEKVKPKEQSDKDTVLVVGGGKSAMDICAKLTLEGRRVVNVLTTPDTFIASTARIPDFIRKSRFLGLLSPHINLNTRLERFLHTTTIGSSIARFILDKLEQTSLDAYKVSQDSPLCPNTGRNSILWGIRTNDEGVVNPKSYYSLVNSGEIKIIAPARAIGYDDDGVSVNLNNGEKVAANVVILATGWKSSWTDIFDEKTASELGIGRHPPTFDLKDAESLWSNYKTLSNPPPSHIRHQSQYVTSIYRGLIPGKNLNNRDFAIAGAIFSANLGYTSEVAAHWISSYFQGDPMRLPSSPEVAVAEAELRSAWMKYRYPNMLFWVNESYSTTLDFWTWPQAADELLEDMYVPNMRSGGNWFTWPFRVIDLKEIATLREERKAIREKRM